MDYESIILYCLNPSEYLPSLEDYFYRQYRYAKREHYSAEEFFLNCIKSIKNLKEDLMYNKNSLFLGDFPEELISELSVFELEKVENSIRQAYLRAAPLKRNEIEILLGLEEKFKEELLNRLPLDTIKQILLIRELNEKIVELNKEIVCKKFETALIHNCKSNEGKLEINVLTELECGKKLDYLNVKLLDLKNQYFKNILSFVQIKEKEDNDAELILEFINSKIDSIKTAQMLEVEDCSTKKVSEKFSCPQTALIHVYENRQITRYNCKEIAKEYCGLVSKYSGEGLRQDYEKYCDIANRREKPIPFTEERLRNRIKLIEGIIKHLSTIKGKKSAESDLENLRNIFNREYVENL